MRMSDQLETARRQLNKRDKNRSSDRASVGQLRNERLVMLEEIAQLKGDLCLMQTAAAAASRREASTARLWGRESRKLGAEAVAEAVAAAAERQVERAKRQMQDANRRAADAEERAEIAQAETVAARQEALEERGCAQELEAERDLAKYNEMLRARQVVRANGKLGALASRVAQLQAGSIAADRTSDEWAALRLEARWKAEQRERDSLRSFLASHAWRAKDLAVVLAETGMLANLFETKEGWAVYFPKVKALHAKLEHDSYGIRFGLYLHYEMKLTLVKLQEIVEAACKEYARGVDRYKKTTWVTNPYNPREFLRTPRIIPARTKLEPVIQEIGASLGVQSSENGKLAFIDFNQVLQEVVARDPGKGGMPELIEFINGRRLPLIVSRDATGKGNLQFTTAAARTPWASKSAQVLHIFGFGCCDDGRSGYSRLLGPNLDIINRVTEAAAEGRRTSITVDRQEVCVLIDPHFIDDVSALRHGEHLANSGWCGCKRDAALRQVPKKPTSVAEMRKLVCGDTGLCRELSCLEREILSHNPPKGESVPRPCTAPGCRFGHDPRTAAKEYTDLLAEEARLAAVTTKAGKAKFSAWRMMHAWKGTVSHLNVPPGLYGLPMYRHHFRKQILDALHLALLGVPKTPWKFGVKNNASDDAREEISAYLKEIGHPLDMRTKDEGRVREAKWFTGEAWISFCAGKGKSPGGPIAIAHIVMIIADDLTMRGVDRGDGRATSTEPSSGGRGVGGGRDTPGGGRGAAGGGRGAQDGGRGAQGGGRGAQGGGRGGGRGRGAFAERVGVNAAAIAPTAPTSTAPELKHVPTAVEAAANQEGLATIRRVYGSRAQTLINILLSFDAYFAWYYPLKKSIPLASSEEVKEARALDNCCSAIEMQEIFERVSICKQGSFLHHGAVFKVTRDILEVGDIWAYDLSALELQNAESKRVYERGGARCMAVTTSGTTHKSTTSDGQVETRLIVTKGYGSTAATSCLKKMLGTAQLRAGDGLYSTPASRKSERLFGEKATGRTKHVKTEYDDSEQPGYSPASDHVFDAFLRLMAARAMMA